MTPPGGPFSIFEDGKLKPGIYKIRNLQSQTYLDILKHSREVCCRPAGNLGDGGLWEIKPLGAGYSIQRVEPGKPDQFCVPAKGINNGIPLFVAPYPVAWRIEVVNDHEHRNFEYIRFLWADTRTAWDLDRGSSDNGRKVHLFVDSDGLALRIWELIHMKPVDGTVLNEVTVETTVTKSTITTRKKYRVEDA